MEIENFKRGFKELCIIFQVAADQDTILAYHKHLSHLTDTEWEMVVNNAIKKIQYVGKLPAVATLLTYTTHSPAVSANEAWDTLMRLKQWALRQPITSPRCDGEYCATTYDGEGGSKYHPPQTLLRKPIYLKVLNAMGGYQHFIETKQTDWDYKRWCELWEKYCADPQYGQEALQKVEENKPLPAGPVKSLIAGIGNPKEG